AVGPRPPDLFLARRWGRFGKFARPLLAPTTSLLVQQSADDLDDADDRFPALRPFSPPVPAAHPARRAASAAAARKWGWGGRPFRVALIWPRALGARDFCRARASVSGSHRSGWTNWCSRRVPSFSSGTPNARRHFQRVSFATPSGNRRLAP